MQPPETRIPPPPARAEEPAHPTAAGARAWARVAGAARWALPPLALVAFWLVAVTIVLDRFPMPGGGSFGFRSLARNFVVVVLLGHLAGARRLRLAPAYLAAPLIAYLAAAVVSVAINGEAWGDVRLLGTVVGFYVAARAVAVGRGGSVLLLHWLGALVVLQLLRELTNQPELLLLREDLRNELVTGHPNSVGYVLAVLLPLFVGVAVRRSTTRGAATSPVRGRTCGAPSRSIRRACAIAGGS